MTDKLERRRDIIALAREIFVKRWRTHSDSVELAEVAVMAAEAFYAYAEEWEE